MVSFDREERNLMLIQALDYFSSSLSGIFVTVYFYNHSDLKTTIFYNVIVYISTLFFYVISGWSLKKVSSAFLIRFSLITSALFFFLLFILKEQSIHYLIPLGLLLGFNAGNYWAGFNLNQYLFTNKEKRAEYFGTVTGIINALSAIAPLLGGAIIIVFNSTSLFGLDEGYSFLFFIVFLILLFMFFLANKLPSHTTPDFSYREIIFHKQSYYWKLILGQQLLLGLYDSSLGIVISILFFLILRSEFNLGGIQTIAYLLGAIGSIFSIKTFKKNKYSFWIGSIGLAIGIGLFGILHNLPGIICFIILTGFFAPFLNNWLSIVYYNSLDNYNSGWTKKYHLMLEREIVLGVSRIVSFLSLFVVLQYGNQYKIAHYWLYGLLFLPLFIGVLLHKMNRLIQNTPEAVNNKIH